ncbi:hypothetical protein OS189_13155 [Sulfitobacter sp. F26169L]|uniref:hypothetical protein n=1 Tax=Sulfitobacter sp. F26169L TaxID=2996015 RepID=UPI002260A5C3|nr:hypothetical protein [Sulfitobacter sp. F26169L]MCX7567294.1 hypothetical protein [Sulfitobacter sp. F26169L]
MRSTVLFVRVLQMAVFCAIEIEGLQENDRSLSRPEELDEDLHNQISDGWFTHRTCSVARHIISHQTGFRRIDRYGIASSLRSGFTMA